MGDYVASKLHRILVMDEHGAIKSFHPWAWSLLIAALVFVGDMTLHRMGLHESGMPEAGVLGLLALGAGLVAQAVRSLWQGCERDHHALDAQL